MNNVAYNIDCVEYMKMCEDNAFDLAIVDPPYGNADGEFKRKDGSRFGGQFDRYKKPVERHGGAWAKKYGYKIISWDDAPGEDYFKELFRISKNQIIWGGKLFPTSTDKVFSDLGKADYQ